MCFALFREQFARITLSEGLKSRCCFKCCVYVSVCLSLASFAEVGVCFVSHARTCRANTQMINPRSCRNDRLDEVSAAFTETSLPTLHVFSLLTSSAVHLCRPPFPPPFSPGLDRPGKRNKNSHIFSPQTLSFARLRMHWMFI